MNQSPRSDDNAEARRRPVGVTFLTGAPPVTWPLPELKRHLPRSVRRSPSGDSPHVDGSAQPSDPTEATGEP